MYNEVTNFLEGCQHPLGSNFKYISLVYLFHLFILRLFHNLHRRGSHIVVTGPGRSRISLSHSFLLAEFCTSMSWVKASLMASEAGITCIL